MKKKTGHKRLERTAGLLLICLLLVGAFVSYIRELDEMLREELSATLQKMSAQNVLIIETEIRSQRNALTEIAEHIGMMDLGQKGEVTSVLREVNERYSFKRMGVIAPDGEAYTTDGQTKNFSERLFFQKSMQGADAISERLTDYFDKKDIIVFSTPIYQKDEVAGVLFATYSVDILRNILNVSSFEGDAYLVNRRGDILVNNGEKSEEGFQNVFDRMDKGERDRLTAENLRWEMEHGGEGNMKLQDGKTRYLQYSPLKYNDWYLINVISAKSIESNRNRIMNFTYLLCMAVCVVLTLFILSDREVEKRKRKELQKILYEDPVTGGYSYKRFCKEAPEALERTGRKSAYLVMDLDKFKLINEQYGHEQGDEVLRYLSRLLAEWKGERELFARRVADRFVALVFYDDLEGLTARLDQFVWELQNRNPEARNGYVFRPTIGVYLVTDIHMDVQSMQNYAVMAHEEAKKEPSRYYFIYNDELRERTLHDKMLEDELELAYKNREFIVYYQPKYDAKTREVIGAEALVRWRKTDGSLVSPAMFIPVAEQSGFIRKLDEYVFGEVCAQQREWMKQGKTLVPVSVNLSRERLKDDSFIERYQTVREENGLPESSVELEITEGAIFEDTEVTESIIDRLHELGFKILMDDFGTGYSSLMMLETVSVDVMKLDKSFVDDYSDERGEKIITCVVQLAHSLNIPITAEGVEKQEQYEFLRELGCDAIQGYYFAKPQPAEKFAQML